MAERRIQLSVMALLMVALTAGCSTLPATSQPPTVENYPVSREPDRERVMNPASASLLEQSRAQQQSGNLAQAAATLDRAVRIDPSESAVWLALARLRYAESNWAQAEQLARRAVSLSAADSPVAVDARLLMAEALRMQGRAGEAMR